MGEAIEVRPQPRQEIFLSSPADIVIYGGAAGGGKTWSMLLEPLRHISNPKFGAVIFRRTIPEITKEGGMWDEAGQLYPLLGAKPNENEHQYRFPTGARVTFAHLQRETTLSDWRGAQIALLMFDQLETFTEQQFFYMLSRNRSTCGVKPYVRATCNPEPGWLADFLSWWISDDGYADLNRAGKIRWFVRPGGDEIIWADSPTALMTRYPGSDPKSVTFVPSTIYDNQALLEKDPGYLGNLKNLPLIDRERLLGDPKRGGNWKIKPAAGKVFNRAWFSTRPAAPVGGTTCLFFDFASTAKELAKDDPDYTAAVVMREKGGEIGVLAATAEQLNPAEVDRLFVNLARQWAATCKTQGSRFKVRWEMEPGSAGKREARRLVKMLAGLDARGVPPLGDKLTRAKPLAAQAEAGNVYLVEGSWNESWLEHMHNQPDIPHDDLMDASSGAYGELALQQAASSGSVDFYGQAAQPVTRPATARTDQEIEEILKGYEVDL